MVDWMDIWTPALAAGQALTAPRAATLNIDYYVDHAIVRTKLQNARIYFFQVRLTNSLAQQALLSSDGMTSLDSSHSITSPANLCRCHHSS